MRTFARNVLITLTLAASATGAHAACDPTPILEIDIAAMVFAPADTEVCLGQTVRWTNKEPTGVPRPIRHTVTADATLAFDPLNVVIPEGAEPFHSGFLLPGATFEHTFTVLGEYKYICVPHEEMGHFGTLRVVE